MKRNCIVCGSDSLFRRENYFGCNVCGHEVLEVNPGQTYIVNEVMEKNTLDKLTALDHFKIRVVKDSLVIGESFLVDLGSATGRFIYQIKGLVSRVAGIEVTPEVLDFSRRVLGLTVVPTLKEIEGSPDVITSWHSLEHIPVDSLHEVVGEVGRKLIPGGFFIVSVPNSRSIQYKLLQRHYAYYDVPNHHHQFSLDSLDRLLMYHGLHRVNVYRSFVYNAFGWVQGLLNLTCSKHNYLYYRLKRNDVTKSKLLDFVQYMQLPFLLPAAAVCSIVESLFPSRQAVLTVRYEKRGERV